MSILTCPSHAHWEVCGPRKDSVQRLLMDESRAEWRGYIPCTSELSWYHEARWLMFKVSPPRIRHPSSIYCGCPICRTHLLPRSWFSVQFYLKTGILSIDTALAVHLLQGPNLFVNQAEVPRINEQSRASPPAEPHAECRSSEKSPGPYAYHISDERQILFWISYFSSGDVDGMLSFIWDEQYQVSILFSNHNYLVLFWAWRGP